jgi:hypothetical protein
MQYQLKYSYDYETLTMYPNILSFLKNDITYIMNFVMIMLLILRYVVVWNA